jgi:hypothetical protein
VRTLQALTYFLLLLVGVVRAASAIDGIPHNGDAQTPEPSSFILTCTGLAAGGYAVYRNRRNKP